MSSSAQLNIVVALACEARWFLDQYRLSRLENPSAYPIYANSARSIYLIVSGVGKIKAAAALSYLHAESRASAHTCYLNAGIAGSQQEVPGTLFLAHKITDYASGRSFYPWPILTEQIQSHIVLTRDRPQPDYPNAALVEMEAFGFHQAAVNLVTQEQVQTVKIISDNVENPAAELNAKLVIELFRQNSALLEKVVTYLLELSATEFIQNKPVAYYVDFLEYFHFTHYQRHQLHELLRRWQINYPDQNPFARCQPLKTAEEILRSLSTSPLVGEVAAHAAGEGY